MAFGFLARIRDAIVIKTLSSVREGEVGGIEIGDYKETDGYFFRVVRGALSRMEEISPARYKRCQNQLRWIVNRSLSQGPGGGRYSHSVRVCSISFAEFGEFDVDCAYTGSTILHEATHGWLLTMGIPYNRNNRLRVERICIAEENRYAERLNEFERGLGDLVAPGQIDETALERHWSVSRWQRLKSEVSQILNSEQGGDAKRD